MEELKACPFCGEELRTEEYRGITNFLCDACGAIISFCFSEEREAAIEAVNRRVAPENKPLTLEELRQKEGKT